MTALTTDRLILRPWQDSDKAPFAAMNADPKVMEYFPALMTKDASDATIDRLNNHIHKHGYGYYALELKDTGEFIGFTGIQNISYETPFTPAVDIGWRIAAQYWGKGYAPEAAKKSTGPRTRAGKRRSSRNGLKHGLRSKLLANGNKALYHNREFLRLMMTVRDIDIAMAYATKLEEIQRRNNALDENQKNAHNRTDNKRTSHEITGQTESGTRNLDAGLTRP